MVNQEDKAMTVNVGTIDRALRVVLGFALIAFALRLGFPDTGWNWIGWMRVRSAIDCWSAVPICANASARRCSHAVRSSRQ